MKHVKSYENYLSEAEDSIAKPLASDESSSDTSSDELTELFDEIKEKVAGCISSLESLHSRLEGTRIPQGKIDSIIADLKGYLQNVEDEANISNNSNQENN